MIDFIEITLIILLATISPGPDFAMVSRNALRYSQKTGMMTGLGVACGTVLHSVYCILGFAMIIAHSLFLFNLIKYAGAAYLIYLGIKGLIEKQSLEEEDSLRTTQELPMTQAFRQGLICTSLNPKAILFFIAFFTIIIKPSMPLYIQSLYALEIALIDLLWFFAISYFFSHQKVKVMLGKSLHYVSKFFGGFLIAFGLKIATFIE